MYIRTKDGRIVAFGKEYAYPTRIVKGNQRYIFTELTEVTFEKMKEFNHWEILNQSENLEELCDCFVIDWLPTNHKDIFTVDKYSKEVVKSFIENNKTNVYGAIWVDGKGLIYVAKMNDKGELELI